MAGLGENQNRRRNARIGLEYARWHGNNRLETVEFHKFLPERLMRLGRTEQHAIRHDGRATSAHFQRFQEQSEEKQLRLFCGRDGEQD